MTANVEHRGPQLHQALGQVAADEAAGAGQENAVFGEGHVIDCFFQ